MKLAHHGMTILLKELALASQKEYVVELREKVSKYMHIRTCAEFTPESEESWGLESAEEVRAPEAAVRKVALKLY